jgi:integrase/recombinase XerD
MPLSTEEYDRLLDAIQIANPRRWDGKMSSQALTANTRASIHALFQLMRWSGLAIRDAVTLERAEIQHDEANGIYRIVTARQKTGTHGSVPSPSNVAKELLTVANGNERYVFWTGFTPLLLNYRPDRWTVRRLTAVSTRSTTQDPTPIRFVSS